MGKKKRFIVLVFPSDFLEYSGMVFILSFFQSLPKEKWPKTWSLGRLQVKIAILANHYCRMVWCPSVSYFLSVAVPEFLILIEHNSLDWDVCIMVTIISVIFWLILLLGVKENERSWLWYQIFRVVKTRRAGKVWDQQSRHQCQAALDLKDSSSCWKQCI